MTAYGSVCSGIEAASVAWEPIGMAPVWFSEIEEFPSRVLRHHWPAVPNLGDMLALPALIRSGLVPAPPVLVGGTPCQAFSVAGARKGLGDDRGQLTMTYVEILNEIDKQRPGDEAVCVWENVPGVLSSSDNAFGCFLGLLSGSDAALHPEPQPPAGKSSKWWRWNKRDGEHRIRWPYAGCVSGPQRTIAWRTLDAQYFGVAQRRRRVFVVASARNGFDPTAVLFERESGRRDSRPGPEHGSPENAGRAPARAFDMLGFGQYGHGLTSSTLKARDYKDWTDLIVTTEGRVRGFMPVERERLQGFPDNHTDVPGAKDSPRYKAIGNSKAVPVVQWIGRRLLAELEKNGGQ